MVNFFPSDMVYKISFPGYSFTFTGLIFVTLNLFFIIKNEVLLYYE